MMNVQRVREATIIKGCNGLNSTRELNPGLIIINKYHFDTLKILKES
jgi:hypothetical protein